MTFLHSRLNDVIQSEGRLYLVFEFVDKDLKKYFEATDGALPWELIQVFCTCGRYSCYQSHHFHLLSHILLSC